MGEWVVHKSRGTVKHVTVEAERLVHGKGGELLFYTGDRLVMGYSAWAWKTCWDARNTPQNGSK